MNIIHFTGNVGKDAELREAGGTDVCNFNVAVKQGFGQDATTEWYRVEVWGKRGESLAQYVKKGGKVAVCGELIIGEYDGKPQYRVRAHDVDPFMNGRADDNRSNGRSDDRDDNRRGARGDDRSSRDRDQYDNRDRDGRRGGGGNQFSEDLEDEVPFASCDPAHDLPRHLRRAL